MVVKNLWKVLSSKSLFKNLWFDVYQEDLQTPGGKVLSGILRMQFPDWVNVVAFTTDGKLLLEKQYRNGVRATTVETPSGSLEQNDPSPEAGAKRELLEETGFVPRDVIHLGSSVVNPNLMNNKMHHFLMLGCQPSVAATPDEDLSFFEVPWAQALDQVRRGDIDHGYSVEGILRAFEYFDRFPEKKCWS